MTAAFQSKPDATPYALEQPRVSLTERNPSNAPAAKEMARMNFDKEDDVDEDVLNDAIWRAIRKDAPPPPPVRSYFGK